MQGKSLIKNALFNIVYRTLNILFPIVSSAYVARVLLADGVGESSLVQNNVSYFVFLGSLGIPAYGVREIAKIQDNINSRNKLFSELMIINAILTFFSLFLFVLFLFHVNSTNDNIYLYMIYGISLILNFINVDWLYQGLEEYVYISVRSIIIKILSLIGVFLFVKKPSDIYVFAIISVLGVSGNYLFNIIHSRKIVKFVFRGLNIKQHIKSLVFLAMCCISTELYARMDITMLGVMKDDNVVGYYTYSQRIINLIITLMVATTAVFLPRLSYYYEKEKKEFNRLLSFGTNLMILLAIPATLGITLVSNDLVSVWLGNGFRPAGLCLKVLAWMIPLKCIGDLVCYQTMMCAKKEKFLMISYFVTMIINFINNIILIPWLGALGASIASLISEVLAFVIVLFYSRKYINVHIDRTNIISMISGCCLMTIILMLINYINMPEFLTLIISVLLGVFIFLGVNLVFKNRFLGDILNKILNKEGNKNV